MTSKGVKFVHVNTRSIYKQIPMIDALYPDVDFLCCSKTWLDDSMPDNLVKLSGKKIVRCDHKTVVLDYNIHVTGGGDGIYIADKCDIPR